MDLELAVVIILRLNLAGQAFRVVITHFLSAIGQNVYGAYCEHN